MISRQRRHRNWGLSLRGRLTFFCMVSGKHDMVTGKFYH